MKERKMSRKKQELEREKKRMDETPVLEREK